MAVPIPFDRELDFAYGRADEVAPGLRRVIARNPSAFTFAGTGTYILGRGTVAVIDPGPAIDAHLDAILEAVRGETVSHILITHTHIDHSPLARPLQAKTGAPIYGYGPHGAGKHEQGGQVEEGGDMGFAPDRLIRDGDTVDGAGWTVAAVHTPGHTSNHLCFRWRERKALFSGDHVMGWSTSVISPPDGDMREYLASLAKLLPADDELYWPTHGAPIRQPQDFVRSFIDHRREREAAILACVKDGLSRIADMVPRIYGDTIDKRLYPAAARSVFAHLIQLAEEGRVHSDGPLALGAAFRTAC